MSKKLEKARSKMHECEAAFFYSYYSNGPDHTATQILESVLERIYGVVMSLSRLDTTEGVLVEYRYLSASDRGKYN